MGVVTLEYFRPPRRYDGLPWTQARVEEATTATGTFSEIETFTLSPVDADPENPDARNFTTELASDDEGLWYRVVFLDADGDEAQPTTPVQNVVEDVPVPFATVNELARILKIRSPTEEQENAMERVMLAAAGEIRSEIDLEDDSTLSGWQLELAASVNLDRAVEHWRQEEVPWGIVGIGSELGTTRIARDTWDRHAHKLAPLKEQWGFA
jgi:hypothetical protein